MDIKESIVSDNSISSYLRFAKDDTPVSVQEERELIKQFQMGDKEARRKLIESNLRFVIKVALGYKGQGLALADLIQEGTLGLIEALGKFDPSKGVRLITYASWWIRLYIQRSIEQKARTVNLPINKLDLLRKMRSFEITFEQNYGRRPDDEEVALKLNVNESQIAALRNLSPSVTSIHSHDEENVGLDKILHDKDIEHPKEKIWQSEITERLSHALRILNRREREVLSWRFGLGEEGETFSLRQVGQKMGLSPEGVRRIEEQALNKLRRPYVARQMEQLLA